VAGNPQLEAVDGTGSAAGFSPNTGGIAVDAAGNLYLTDTYRHTLRKVSPAGVVTTVAGILDKEGVLSGALPGGLSYPTGIAADANGDLYVSSNNAILKIQLPPR
jgi:sugar lactone lactonase YvrE